MEHIDPLAGAGGDVVDVKGVHGRVVEVEPNGLGAAFRHTGYVDVIGVRNEVGDRA